MTETNFPVRRFVPTQHSTAKEKARFCDCFARFVLGGFARKAFKPAFYRRLSNIFGHIANYDETGFYEVWFSTPAQQRHFIQCIHEHVPVGDPHFCWSDVERELKSWTVTNAAAIEAVIAENERKSAEAEKSETDRRAALAGKTRQQFRVVARSSNTGGFGERQYILCAQDGSAWKVQRYYGYPWETGQVVTVPLVGGDPDWAAVQCECPERMPDCPQPVEA